MLLTVAPDGTGDFQTLQAAVDAATDPAETVIRVRPGVYREKVCVTRDCLRIVGEDPETTVLVFGDHARQLLADGTEKGTFLSYTLIVTGNDVTLENLTIANDAGPGDRVGQAIALYAAGDRGVARNCRLIAHQDTLFCGPCIQRTADGALPRRLPADCDSASDPAPLDRRQYFENCLIRGDVDFIFGSYRCWFERCTLVCNNRGERVNGFYTAANTPADQPYGFVFNRCALTGDGCDPDSVYLGRPWRSGGRTVFKRCRMDACVKDEGWSDWGRERRVTHRFAEFGTVGDRADTWRRHPGAALLTAAEAEALTPGTVLGGSDGWNPSL